jgi:hypothetical protein
MEPVLYDPRDPPVARVRLLKLVPGVGYPIRINVHDFVLTEAPTFEALSYTWWGEAQEQQQQFVECNGRQINVVKALHTILHFLRQSQYQSYLWVDAISIEQSDPQKKHAGIHHMPLVYRTASRTLCWVGLEQLAQLRTMIATTETLGKYEDLITNCLSATEIYHSTPKVAQEHLRTFEAASTRISQATWQHVNVILGQPYFTR